ncbi:BRCT domain-containing protein [Desulfatiglans anilini]|uniref:BRCT domain-containing protein n=1 Tax=Desulfatiglans anilini TaxID=90728 RepID=UPI00041A8B57|nr:BRCT domain-containing protein [Desulfatiglans anilini]
MDLFTRFNRKSIDDRQIDTLIGISKGLVADGRVDQSEAEFLLIWLIQARQNTDNPVIMNLLNKVCYMLEDGVLDPDESAELLSILHKINGEPSEIGELAKTTSLPVDYPLPSVTFEGMEFLFTGTCIYGTRKQCQAAIESLGGVNAKGVTKKLNYLILGTYVTDSWAHETYGRKIEKALQYREEGVPLVIITEEHWINEGSLS